MKDNISIESNGGLQNMRSKNQAAAPQNEQAEAQQENRINSAKEVEQKDKVLSDTERDKLIQKADNFVKALNTRITFRLDDESGSKIIVEDKQTGKVLRQIPPEEFIDLNEKMDEIVGIIFNRRV